jgi:hypothetical protein
MMGWHVPWWFGLLVMGLYVVAAQPGAIPVAWATARLYPRGGRRIVAAFLGWVFGMVLVAFGWLVAMCGDDATGGRINPDWPLFLIGYVPPGLFTWALVWEWRRRAAAEASEGGVAGATGA